MGLRSPESTLYRGVPRFCRAPSGVGAIDIRGRSHHGCYLEQTVYIIPGRALRGPARCGIRGNGIMQTALRLLDKDMMDKQRALDAALGQIERAFGKGSVMKLGSREAASDCDVISTGSLGLDIALGIGGLPRGRVI